jgi:ABC-type spermidine/putrescine transport system permease subunit II
MSQALAPMAVLVMYAVMEQIDRNVLSAARTLGAGPGNAFWRVFMPLALPGVVSATLLVFISALGFFITPVLLGGRHQTMITQLIIQQVQEVLNWPFAGAVSVLLLLTALTIYWMYDKMTGLSSLDGSASRPSGSTSGGGVQIRIFGALGHAADRVGAAARGLVIRPGRRAEPGIGKALWLAIGGAVVAFLCFPMLVMVPISFSVRPTIDWPPTGFTLKWYAGLLDSSLWFSAIARSLAVGVASAVLTMLVSFPAAFALARHDFRAKKILTALFYLFAQIGLIGTTLGLVLGHTVISVPFVVMSLVGVLKGYDVRYEQAAATLGAKRPVILWRITLPLLKMGIVSGLLLGFLTSFDDLTIALFVTGGLTATLPKMMWDDAIMQVTPTIAAASTLLIVTMLVALVAMEWARGQSRRGGVDPRKS